VALLTLFLKAVRASSTNAVQRRVHRRLRLEPLENRRMLATFTVTTLADATVNGPNSAPGTLRQAIYDANSASDPDTIKFAPNLTGDLRLSVADDSAVGLSALFITSPITIQGNSAGITIKRDITAPYMRFFRVALGADLTIDSLNITTGLTVGDNGAPGLSGGTAFGGAIYNQGNLQVSNSTLYNNSTIGGDAGAGGLSGPAHGGAIFSDGGRVTIVNSTLSGNSAKNGNGPRVALSFGGGLYIKNGSLTIDNSTITNGLAGSGREVYVIALGAGQSATVHIESSILAQADVDRAIFDVNLAYDLGGQVIASGANNLIRTHNAPASLVASGEDPLLAPLANNGGITLTHALQSQSPAINQGSNPLNLPRDQRGGGFSRAIGGQADIGAFEVQSIATPDLSGDYNRDNSVDARDYVFWRKTLGASVTPFAAADGNGNSAIDPGDYDVWRGHFGASPPVGNSLEATAPATAVQVADNDESEALVPKALSASLAGSYDMPMVASQPSTAILATVAQSQSATNPEAHDQALLSIVSLRGATEPRRTTASRRVHPDGNDAAASRELSTALIQSPLQTLPCAAASTGTA
jgi:hypothetical protein